MKSIIITCVVAALLFTLSAALSLFLTTANKPDADHGGKQAHDGKTDKKKQSDAKHDAKHPDGDGHADAHKSKRHPPKADSDHSDVKKDDPAALLSRLRQRDRDLQLREEEVQRQEQRIQLVIDDINAERAVMDTIRAQIAGELKRLDDRREKIDLNTRSLDEQKRAAKSLLEKLEKEKIAFGQDEVKNIGRMATISDSMPADRAARLLEQFASTGQMETAVKLLGQMKERRAAAVLAEMTDLALGAQLLDKLRGLKRPAAPEPPPDK